MKTYGTFELTAASPPQSFVEPIDTRQVRTWLGLNETDPDDDQDLMLEALISAARSVAEIHQHRDLAVKQWDYTLDEFPDEIELPSPLVSVDLFQYTDSTSTTTALVDGTNYSVDTSRGIITPVYNGSWPTATLVPSGGILVRFTSGYSPSHSFWQAAEGTRIIQGMRLLIAMWHENRIPVGEAPETVIWLFNMNPNLSIA